MESFRVLVPLGIVLVVLGALRSRGRRRGVVSAGIGLGLVILVGAAYIYYAKVIIGGFPTE
jgi:O-antigen ligase